MEFIGLMATAAAAAAECQKLLNMCATPLPDFGSECNKPKISRKGRRACGTLDPLKELEMPAPLITRTELTICTPNGLEMLQIPPTKVPNKVSKTVKCKR